MCRGRTDTTYFFTEERHVRVIDRDKDPNHSDTVRTFRYCETPTVRVNLELCNIVDMGNFLQSMWQTFGP